MSMQPEQQIIYHTHTHLYLNATWRPALVRADERDLVPKSDVSTHTYLIVTKQASAKAKNASDSNVGALASRKTINERIGQCISPHTCSWQHISFAEISPISNIEEYVIVKPRLIAPPLWACVRRYVQESRSFISMNYCVYGHRPALFKYPR